MKSELQDIADKLQGYSDTDYYDIEKAEKNADGAWVLTVKHIVKTEGAKNESNE